MENTFLANKIVLKYCKDYYRIINEEFSESDYISDKLIQTYQSFIFSIDVKNKTDVKKITMLNDALVRYFDDMEFKKMLTSHLVSLKVSKNEVDINKFIVESIIKEYKNYMEGFTRNLYIPRWI